MPTRLIRDSIFTSESVSQMSDFQFRVWISLLVYVDDYGRGDARAAIIKGHCFPLAERTTAKQIDDAIDALVGLGSVVRYTVNGKPYLYIPTWERYQNVRNQKSKYPAPVAADDGVLQIADDCKQLNTIVCKSSRNPIQSESNPNPYCTERSGDPSMPEEPAEPAVFRMETTGGGVYEVTQSEIDKYTELYPNVDVEQEYRNMIGWLESNKTRRKTMRGMPKFINGWLAREQDRGGKRNNGPARMQNKNDEAPLIPKFKFYDE